LRIAADLDYLPRDQYRVLAGEYNILGRQLNRLILAWREGQPPNREPATSD